MKDNSHKRMKDNSHKRRGNPQQQHDAYDYNNYMARNIELMEMATQGFSSFGQ